MQRQVGHAPAEGSDPAAFRQCAEILQQATRMGEGCRRGRIQPPQGVGFVNAPGRQFQRQAGQIDVQDLGPAAFTQVAMGRLAPEPIADTRSQTSGASAALVGRRAGYRQGGQAGHAAHRIESRHAAQSAVHHHPDAFDGQAGFGDGSGQHDFAPPGRSRGDGRVLPLPGEVAVERGHRPFRRQPAIRQQAGRPPDLRGTGEKDQQTARIAVNRAPDHIHHGALEGLMGRTLHIAGRDWIQPPVAADQGRILQQVGHRRRFQGGRHHQQPQVCIEHPPDIQAQGQPQIGLQAAFVEFVEDHQPHTVQRGIVLQHARQHALGHHLDAGFRANAPFHAHAVADDLSDALAKPRRHVPGRRPCGQAPRRQQQHPPTGHPRFVQKRRWHRRRLAGAGRCHQHRRMVVGQGAPQRRQRFVNRQCRMPRYLFT